jgi:NAD(P)-dependent dehydrogenase (short-subunit alcohol dehydrogenase family)
MPEGGNWKDLFKAAEVGDTALARYHIAGGVDPNFQHPEYFTAPIFEAIRNSHMEIVKILVEEGGANPALIEELTDDTTIDAALESRSFEILDYLNTKLPFEKQYKSRHILVTEGIICAGKELIYQLLLKGHSVVFLTGESEEEAISAKKVVCSATGNPKLDYILGSLDSIAMVHDIVEKVRKKAPSINTLIHNACLWSTHRILNDDRLEMSFMINYLARYVLNKELMPLLDKNGPSRIVYVAPEITLMEPDLIDTPYGNDFHWRNTFLKTLSCGATSFLNSIQTTNDKSVTMTLVHSGRAHSAMHKAAISGCVACFVGIAKSIWQDPENVAETAVWLSEAGECEAFHGKVFNSQKEEINSMATMPIPREWEQWTIDFLSRSDITQ